MNVKSLTCAICLFVVVMFAADVNATLTYDVSNIEDSVGSGDNSATIVVDFAFASYLVFTYNWDTIDAPTGFDSAVALDDGTTNTIDVTVATYNWGSMITDFDHPAAAKIDYINDFGSPVETLGWGYYISTDNENWTSPGWGANYYNMQDGDFVTWVWTNSAPEGHPDGWGTQYRGPGELPQAIPPVPEPATMGLLALGGLLIRARRNK